MHIVKLSQIYIPKKKSLKMNLTKNNILIIIHSISMLLIIACNPTTPPTVLYYSENGSVILIDDTSAYIENIFIDIYGDTDSFKFHYPIEGDSFMRSQINLPEYFQFDKKLLKNKKIKFSIYLGVRKTKRGFIHCYNEINTSEIDSIFNIQCAWR